MKNLVMFPSGIVIAFALFFSNISCADTATDSLNKSSHKYLSFYETIEGDRIHWEVNFNGNEITSIYKNGKRIPDDLANDYKGKVYNQLDEMRFARNLYSFNMHDFDLNFDELHKNMERLREKFKDHKLNMGEFKLDDEKLKQEMEKLKEKLKEYRTDKFQWKFDNEEFRMQMRKLEENLKENLKNFKFEFDFDEKNNKDEI